MAIRETTKRKERATGRGIAVLFVVVAVAGGAVIISLRMLGYHPLVAAGTGSGLILLYALLAMPLKPKALSTGVIGDNCYYLGFIFTLTSLAWSLYGVGSEGQEREDFVLNVVSGFGIALLTTAVGVVLRVALNPARVDMVEEEQAAFNSIRHYYDLMQRDLASLTATNKQFALGLKASLNEFRQAFHADLRTEAEARTKTTLEIIGDAEKRFQTRLAELDSELNEQLTSAVTRMGQEAEGATDRAISAASRTARTRLAATMREFRAAAAATGEDCNDAMERTASGATETVDTLSEMLTKLDKATTKLNASAATLSESVPRRTGDLVTAVQANIDAISKALDDLEAASKTVSARMATLRSHADQIERDLPYSEPAGRGRWPFRWISRGR
ncbi:hypothetical protein [Ruegeria sp. HKCCD8929]|uniref:hypothetical protein n=1 Tax=Ruegeria sp. HKCCD8929 TaxID=2683006 RepID=UPI001489EE88|nr:hypothetical protein [Ruegeria sp. HKCCD8929]